MERQTNDNPQTNMETLLNYAYDKDENVHLRYADEKYDVALHEFIAKNCPAEESADEIMEGACFECDVDCTYGLINSIAIQAAELRGRLKEYEDVCFDENGNERITIDHIAALAQAESEGRLHIAPYKEGDTIYRINANKRDQRYGVHEEQVTAVDVTVYVNGIIRPLEDLLPDREAAEAVLAAKEGERE